MRLAIVLLLALTDWSIVVKPALKQVVRLEMLREGESSPGVCSGVVINETAGYVLTAAHCVEKPEKEGLSVTVNGRHADVVRVNRLLDLGVVRFDVKGEKEMALADSTPPIGTEVSIVGHAFGDAKLICQFGRIAQALNEPSQMIFLNADVIGGDSGGAVIDVDGKLVGITSRVYYNGPMHLGAAVPVESVRDFVKGYLPKAKP